MKNILLILTLFITTNLYSSEIDTLVIHSDIKDVTVFFDGAQILREAKINVTQGKYLLVIDKLPAEINPQSIQIDNHQQGKILSVKHQLTYPSTTNVIAKQYETKIKQQEIKYNEIANEINVYKIEEDILMDNSTLHKKEEGTTIAEIKEASDFYRAKLNEIKRNKLYLSLQLDSIKQKIRDLYKEQNKKLSKENKTYSKISFALDCETSINSVFTISYYVSSAAWSPLYDFRVTDIHKPLNITYNANIYQSTGEDWNNVNLTLSTNRPSLSNIKPELDTWFINRKKKPKKNNKTQNSQNNVQQDGSYTKTSMINGQSALKGQIIDQETKEPVPFASLEVKDKGEIIARTTSDFDGLYTIKPIKSGCYTIKVSSVGYQALEVKGVCMKADEITFQDLKLKSTKIELAEIEVVEYKVPLIQKDQTTTGVTFNREDLGRPTRYGGSLASSVGGIKRSRNKEEDVHIISGYESSTNITSLEYKIDIPYSIPSDGNDYSVKIKEVNKPVNYVYYAIPKLDPEVFLIAELSDWTQLNLLSGTSSIYYKGTFTGASEIDANSTQDTLELSLNRDKNIVVKRELLKEQSERQFIGRDIKETVSWNITVKNNKNESAKIFVEDQFPISEKKAVRIERLEHSNGRVDDKTGQVIWELELAPNEKKELLLQYTIIDKKHHEKDHPYIDSVSIVVCNVCTNYWHTGYFNQ